MVLITYISRIGRKYKTKLAAEYIRVRIIIIEKSNIYKTRYIYNLFINYIVLKKRYNKNKILIIKILYILFNKNIIKVIVKIKVNNHYK